MKETALVTGPSRIKSHAIIFLSEHHPRIWKYGPSFEI
jgi:hypothetical protein